MKLKFESDNKSLRLNFVKNGSKEFQFIEKTNLKKIKYLIREDQMFVLRSFKK